MSKVGSTFLRSRSRDSNSLYELKQHFTRHQAAVQSEQMHRMDDTERKERIINRSIRGKSNEQHCGDTSDEEIITACDEQFISGSES